jgi:hypothetical protein
VACAREWEDPEARWLWETFDHGDDFLALIAKMSSELYELTNLF